MARMVPSTIGMSYDLPVRLSVMVSVSGAALLLVAGAFWGRVAVGMREGYRRSAGTAPETPQQSAQVGGQGRSEGHLPAVGGVPEREAGGVQGGPADVRRRPPVPAVADERVAGLREMDADLVLPAGDQAHGHDRGVRQSLRHTELGDRLPPLPRPGGGLHLEAVPVLHDPALEAAPILRDPSLDHGDVTSLDRPLGERGLEGLVGRVRAREQEEPRGVAVEPVDREERSTPDAAGALGFENPIDQAVLVPQRRRDREDVRPLVDDEDVVVAMHDAVAAAGSLPVFRLVPASGVELHLESLARGEAPGVLARRDGVAARDAHPAGVDETTGAGVAETAALVEERLERPAGVGGAGLEGEALHRACDPHAAAARLRTRRWPSPRCRKSRRPGAGRRSTGPCRPTRWASPASRCRPWPPRASCRPPARPAPPNRCTRPPACPGRCWCSPRRAGSGPPCAAPGRPRPG